MNLLETVCIFMISWSGMRITQVDRFIDFVVCPVHLHSTGPQLCQCPPYLKCNHPIWLKKKKEKNDIPVLKKKYLDFSALKKVRKYMQAVAARRFTFANLLSQTLMGFRREKKWTRYCILLIKSVAVGLGRWMHCRTRGRDLKGKLITGNWNNVEWVGWP